MQGLVNKILTQCWTLSPDVKDSFGSPYTMSPLLMVMLDIGPGVAGVYEWHASNSYDAS